MFYEAQSSPPEFDHRDLLRGSKQIAEYLGMTKPQVDNLVLHDCVPGVFKWGRMLCLRRSTFAQFMAELEEGSAMKAFYRNAQHERGQ